MGRQWKVESGQGRDLIVRSIDGATIAIMGSNSTHDDSHRICACIAACEGIPTAVLDAIGKGMGPNWLEAKKQRDNAREELAQIRDAIGADSDESTLDEVRRVVAQRDRAVSDFNAQFLGTPA